MSMSDHIKQQLLQDFFCHKVSFSSKMAKPDSFVLPEWENQHTSKLSYLFGVEAAWHTVLICCTMCGTEQLKEQPQIGDRGSNPVAINQFLIFFFSFGSTCSRSLFSFANILYFTWFTSFDLILLWNSSYVFAQHFLLKISRNNLRIK